MLRVLCSQDALHAILSTIVALSAPIVNRLGDEAVNVAESILKVHAPSIREQAELQVAD